MNTLIWILLMIFLVSQDEKVGIIQPREEKALERTHRACKKDGEVTQRSCGCPDPEDVQGQPGSA